MRFTTKSGKDVRIPESIITTVLFSVFVILLLTIFFFDSSGIRGSVSCLMGYIIGICSATVVQVIEYNKEK